MRLNWLHVVLCFFVVQPSYAGSLVPLTGISKINVFDDACAITNGGSLKCWGYNNLIRSDTPIDTAGLASNVRDVAGNSSHICVLTTAGGLKCWGNTILGAFGNGTTDSSNIPVDINGMTSGLTAISIGEHHACALTISGGVKCWGSNQYGQLGNGTTINTGSSSSPVNVTGLTSGVIAISSGGAHTCALTVNGFVKCWGANHEAQLGIGIQKPPVRTSTIPVDVINLSGVTSISAGAIHTCAVITGGGAKCWGSNMSGQIGGADDLSSPLYSSFLAYTPLNVVGLSGVTAIAAGNGHTCAVVTNGNVKCWGNNTFGQVLPNKVDNQHNQQLTPVLIDGISGVTAISAGLAKTCAIVTGGSVKCWGGYDGQALSDGKTTDTVVDVLVDSNTISPCQGLLVNGICTPTNKPPIDLKASFAGYNIHDVVTEGTGSNSVVYALLSKLSGSGKFYTNPDGTKFYERDIFVAKASSSQFVLSTSLGKLPISHGTLSVDNSLIRVFFNNKTATITDYSMSGTLKLIDKNNLSIVGQSILFSNANWGWYPKFVGSDVEHFSFAGTYRMYNTANNGVVNVSTMRDEAANYIFNHSQGVIPLNSASVNPGEIRADAAHVKIVDTIVTKLAKLCSSSFENLGTAKDQRGVDVPNITLCGGIQVSSGARQNKVIQRLGDVVDISANINVDTSNYIGQSADLVVYASYTPLNSKTSLNFMLNEHGVPVERQNTLVAFKSNVTLSKTQELSMYAGKFVGTGRLLVYFGFRLKKDGIVISNSTPIDILINP